MPKLFDSNTPLSPFLDNDQVAIAEAADFTVLQISGNEAKDFLQNMTSNDVNALIPERNIQLSTFNNGKGRIEASFFLLRTQDDGFLMILHTSLLAIILKKLTMFKLRAEVTITALTDAKLLTISGEGAAEMSSQLTALSASTPLSCAMDAHTKLINLPTKTPCLFILTDYPGAIQLSEDARLLGATPAQANRLWQIFVESNLPFVTDKTTTKFAIQMINYDLIDGVNFKKGCYPGQEVVARMHYLGRPSRRTYLMQTAYDPDLNIGEKIFDAGGSTIGEIVNVSQTSHDNMTCLACLKVKHATAHCFLTNGESLALLEQPYEI